MKWIYALLLGFPLLSLVVFGVLFIGQYDGGLAVGAPTSSNNFRDITPETDATYDLGTASKRWERIFARSATTTSLTILDLSGSGTRCVETDNDGDLSLASAACGSGTNDWQVEKLSGNFWLRPTTTIDVYTRDRLGVGTTSISSTKLQTFAQTGSTTGFAVTSDATTAIAFKSYLNNDAEECFQIRADGRLAWGGCGAGAVDTTFGISGSDELQTGSNDNLTVGNNLTVTTGVIRDTGTGTSTFVGGINTKAISAKRIFTELITSTSTSNVGAGDLQLKAYDNPTGDGGAVEVHGGNASGGNGGQFNWFAGDSTTAFGGNMTFTMGDGVTDGLIIFNDAVDNEVVRLSSTGSFFSQPFNASSTAHITGATTIGDILTVQGTGTSTFTGGIFANDFSTNLPSCDSLDTNASGAIVCGVDANSGGGGAANLIQILYGTTKYYTASTTATTNLGWHFNNGFVSSGSTTIAGNLFLDGEFIIRATTTNNNFMGVATTSPWGLVSIEQLPNMSPVKPLFVVGDTGTTSAHFMINQKGQALFKNLNSNTIPAISFYNDTNTGIYSEGADTINFSVGGSHYMRLESDGDLAFVTSAANQFLAAGLSNAATPDFSSNIDPDTGIGLSNDNTIRFSSNGVEMMRLTSSGFSITGDLSVTGNTTATSSVKIGGGKTEPQLWLSDYTAGSGLKQWAIRSTGGNLYFATSSDALATSSPPALTINSTGYGLFVGTTTNKDATGLAVHGRWYATGLDTESGVGDALCLKTNGEIVHDDSPLTACSGASSRTVKHDITNLSNSLELILGLKPISYVYNENYTSDQTTHLGFIVEDVELLEPRLVDVPTGNAPKGLKYNEFVSPIVGAIQDLFAKFQELVARVSGLEQRIEKQDDRIRILEERLNNIEKK